MAIDLIKMQQIKINFNELELDFKKLEKYALDLPEIKNESAQLEVIKGTLNQYLLRAFSFSNAL